jgi:hypothetical protein
MGLVEATFCTPAVSLLGSKRYVLRTWTCLLETSASTGVVGAELTASADLRESVSSTSIAVLVGYMWVCR